MKYLFIFLLLLFSKNDFAQTPQLKPCTIIFIHTRTYIENYNGVDSMEKVLKAVVTRNSPAEFRDRNIEVKQGWYKDSTGVRYYFNLDKSPLKPYFGKVLKAIPK